MQSTPELSPASSRRSSESGSPSSALSSPTSKTTATTRASPPPPLDFSQLPPPSQPAPATNTLLFTNLLDADIFRPENLETIRSLVAQTAPIHAWAPLRSFGRIVVSFHDEDAAAAVRAVWDGEAIMGARVRVYYGGPTPIEARDEHLALPDAGKLFFISPPPSPPCGWEMRLEDAPNKLVHADDLADALSRLHKKHDSSASFSSAPASPFGDDPHLPGRARSGSATLIYTPQDHDAELHLPAIAVEDMTDDSADGVDSPAHSPRILAHTSRPPLELAQ